MVYSGWLGEERAEGIGRLLQESSGLMPQMGSGESSLVVEWVPGDCENGSSTVGEAGREWGPSSRDGVGASLPAEPGRVCTGLEALKPQP